MNGSLFNGRSLGEEREVARVRLGIISLRGTNRPVNASPYYMRRAMERWAGETTHLGGRHRISFLGAWMARRLGRVSEEVYIQRVHRHLRRAPQDLLVGMYSGSILANLGPTSAPIVYVTDAAAHDLIDAYPQFSNLSKAEIAEVLRLEELGVARSEVIITHTDWAARSLIEKAGAAPERVVVVPVGTDPETIPADVEPTAMDPEGVLEAVFIGRDWERKGLSKAVQAIETLNSRGVPAHLTVLGCNPPAEVLGRHTTTLGLFDQGKRADVERLAEVLTKAHAHLLPSEAECFGITVAETGSYYTPSIVTDVQGLSHAVRDGVSGVIVSPEGRPEELADVMASWYADPDHYLELCRGVRRDVEERLNWDAWGQSVVQALAERFA